MHHHSLAILKPDCLRQNDQGKVIQRILDSGFKIIAMKQLCMSKIQAEGFYAVHKDRSFYKDLTVFMSSGPCVPMVLEKEGAVAAFRQFIGATDPKEAAPGTIRKDFAKSKQENIIHGSDSDENAAKEIAFFFSEAELIINRQ
jgi:nucleoside-diphosphate kinase